MASAWPSGIGTTGYTSSSAQPRIHSGTRGPGMLETTRLNVRGWAITRETAWRSVRGA